MDEVLQAVKVNVFWLPVLELVSTVTLGGTLIVTVAGLVSAALQPVWPSPLFATIQ
jgi:hypothetical protein